MKRSKISFKSRKLLNAVAIIVGIHLALPCFGEEIRFAGSPTWYGHVPVMVAIKKGIFKAHGLEVKFVPIVASSDRLRAITSGSIEFANLGRTAVLSDMARGNTSFYLLANVDDAPGNEGCWAKPEYKTVQSLKGRQVAVNGSSEITLDGILQSSSMKRGDVKVLNLSPNEMAGALTKGDVDAACVWEPLLTGLKNAVPGGHLIGTDKDTAIYKKYGTMAAGDIVVISKKFVDENPRLANQVLTALLEGADFANASPKETALLVSSYFQKTPTEIESDLKSFQYFGTDNWKQHLSLHMDEMQELGQILNSTGRIPSVPNVRNWFNGQVTVETPKKK